MGSYLSIQNDTSDVWYAKIGPDQAAISISGLVGAVIGGVALIIGTGGAAVPLVTSLETGGVIGIMGLTTANLAAITGMAGAAGAVGTATGVAAAVSDLIHGELDKQGMVRIEPGQKYRWGKMSLSLWQQGTCVRTRVNPQNANELLIDTLYMRPIFSGQTADSENVHTIRYWIDKWGVETKTVAIANAQ